MEGKKSFPAANELDHYEFEHTPSLHSFFSLYFLSYI
jgi:hypothetical protein